MTNQKTNQKEQTLSKELEELQTEKIKNTLAQALNEDPNSITATNPHWLQLMQEGVLASLHIGRWRAKSALKWDDLGIELKDQTNQELQKIFNLGYKTLLPSEILRKADTIERKARSLLEKMAYKTYWGWFIPVSAYAEWKQKITAIEKEYLDLRDTIYNTYTSLITEVLQSYQVAANEAYHRLIQLNRNGNTFPPQQEFVKTFIASIRRRLPPAQQVCDSFHFSIELQYIPLPHVLAAEQAQAQQINRQQWVEQQKAQAEVAVTWKQSWAEQQKIEAQALAAKTAAQHKAEQLKQMNADIVQQTKKQKETLVDDFLRDLVVQLRQLTYDVTTNVLASLKQHNTLRPRSVVQLRHLIKQVKNLNFYGDQEIEQIIKHVEINLQPDAEHRNIATIKQNLTDISTVCHATIINLGQKPRQSRKLTKQGITPNQLGISQAEPIIRQARRNLNLSLPNQKNTIVELSHPPRQPRQLELTQTGESL